MSIIAVANQKGGVGKTTTSQALIAGLADKGYKVLGIDLDPQGNLSSACGSENYYVPTIYELMKREVNAEEAIQHMSGRYDIIPSNIMLAGAEQELFQIGKEHRLKEVIAPVSSNYDYIIVDTPHSLGVLTVNAFTAASDILIPTTAGIFATAGINQLNETVKSVQKYCNPNVKIIGILFTRFNPRVNISKQIKELTEQLSQYISAPIYKTYIRSAIAVEEAQANRRDIFDYTEKSTVSEDYKAFIEEFLKGEAYKPSGKGGRPPVEREPKKRITLALYPSIYGDLQKIAYVNRQSASDLVSELIADYVAANSAKLKKYDIIKEHKEEAL